MSDISNKEKTLLALFTILIIGMVLYLIPNYKSFFSNVSNLGSSTSTEENNKPVKTDFGTQVSPDLPESIPLEKGVKLEQSLNFDYTNVSQKQISEVFSSIKTISENFTFYKNFLEKDGWEIVNKDDSKNPSFLYATKDSYETNITISPPQTNDKTNKSQVSISLLKK